MSRDPGKAGSQFFGGRVGLDFANTVDWRSSDSPQELIPDYPSLLAWSVRRGILGCAAEARLLSTSARKADLTTQTLQQAFDLRSDIWRAAEDLRNGRPARLESFNTWLAALPPQPKLVRHEGVYSFDIPGVLLEEPLWLILWSVTALLTSEDASRVGCCQATGCGWYFVDESPNHTRSWCSSEVCGNRERVRRAYAKRRKSL
jgi:predicted RNA-binding Zn ribbon-like protein